MLPSRSFLVCADVLKRYGTRRNTRYTPYINSASCLQCRCYTNRPPSPTSLTQSPTNLDSNALLEPTAPLPNSLPTQIRIQRQKDRWRGGQNLSERWHRLERSLRGKEAYGAHRDTLVDQTEDAEHADGSAASLNIGPPTFHGLVVPEKPKEPQSDECCMSGCAVCVYDIYEAAREDYMRAVDTLRAALDERGIPEREWPEGIRRRKAKNAAAQAEPKQESPREAITNAFEAFERALREKKERGTAGAG